MVAATLSPTATPAANKATSLRISLRRKGAKNGESLKKENQNFKEEESGLDEGIEGRSLEEEEEEKKVTEDHVATELQQELQLQQVKVGRGRPPKGRGRGRPPFSSLNQSIHNYDQDEQHVAAQVPSASLLLKSAQPAPARKRGRPRKYPLPESDLFSTSTTVDQPFKSLDANATITSHHSHASPKRRCQDCNTFLKVSVPFSQSLCNECMYDEPLTPEDDDEFTTSKKTSSKKRTRTLSSPRRFSFLDKNGNPITNDSTNKENVRQLLRPDTKQDSPRASFALIEPRNPSAATSHDEREHDQAALAFTRVTSPAPSYTSTSSHHSNTSNPNQLPKRFPCPQMVPEYYCVAPVQEGGCYFYPSPAALEEAEDRVEFLISRIHEMDQFQLAQVNFCLNFIFHFSNDC